MGLRPDPIISSMKSFQKPLPFSDVRHGLEYLLSNNLKRRLHLDIHPGFERFRLLCLSSVRLSELLPPLWIVLFMSVLYAVAGWHICIEMRILDRIVAYTQKRFHPALQTVAFESFAVIPVSSFGHFLSPVTAAPVAQRTCVLFGFHSSTSFPSFKTGFWSDRYLRS